MPTLNMPPKGSGTVASVEEEDAPGQARPALLRYRLQVDRQTKASFKERADAENKGKEIKRAYPKVRVTLYDAETEEQMTIT
jgi:hypothetical protein